MKNNMRCFIGLDYYNEDVKIILNLKTRITKRVENEARKLLFVLSMSVAI